MNATIYMRNYGLLWEQITMLSHLKRKHSASMRDASTEYDANIYISVLRGTANNNITNSGNKKLETERELKNKNHWTRALCWRKCDTR